MVLTLTASMAAEAIDLMHSDVISQYRIVGFVVTVFSLWCISLTTTALHSYTAWNPITFSLQTTKTGGLVFFKSSCTVTRFSRD